MFSILIIAGLLVFAYACQTFENRYVAKLGWITLLAATYLGGYFLSGSHVAGAVSVSLWFVLPWVEILGRVRQLRIPLKNEVSQRFPPSRDVFPNLGEISREVEDQGFTQMENSGWRWDEADHFVRLFYHAESRTQAAVSLAQQMEFAVSYVSVTSRTADGRIFTTSNYPFSYTMKFSPEHKVHRFVEAESFEDLLEAHRAFLQEASIALEQLAEQDAEQLAEGLAADMQQQIQHNVRVGVLEPAGDDVLRYTWRGCWFLWLQVVKDMLRV
jgi:hypothetical protein